MHKVGSAILFAPCKFAGLVADIKVQAKMYLLLGAKHICGSRRHTFWKPREKKNQIHKYWKEFNVVIHTNIFSPFLKNFCWFEGLSWPRHNVTEFEYWKNSSPT